MASADLTAEAPRRPFTGRRVRFGDLVLQVVAGAAALGVTVLVGLIIWKVIEAGLAGDREVRDLVRLDESPGTRCWAASSTAPGASSSAPRSRSFVALLLAAPLAMGIALFLTELAPTLPARPGHRARRDARRHPERRARPLGDPRARAAARDDGRAVAAQRVRVHPALRRAERLRRRHLHGDRRPDDHDPADRLEHHPRAVPRRAARPEGGRARARHDALGDGQRRHVPVRARRHRGGADPRLRPRHRRGDRRHAGDRRRRRYPLEPLRAAATRSAARSPPRTRARRRSSRPRR